MTLFNRSPFRCRACNRRFYVLDKTPDETPDDVEGGAQATDRV
jgi:hypothetical protein